MTHYVRNLHLLPRSSFINSLANVPKHHTHLDISGNKLSQRSLKALIMALAKIPTHVTSIDIRDNGIDENNYFVCLFLMCSLPKTIISTMSEDELVPLPTDRSDDKYKTFSQLLATLKAIRFIDFIELIENTANQHKDDSTHTEAFDAAQKLLNELNDLVNTWFKKIMNGKEDKIISEKEFKEGCLEAIENARAILAAHDSWATILTDFIHHIVAFCTFGKIQMNHYYFFSNTHSPQKVDELVSHLDNAVLGVPA